MAEFKRGQFGVQPLHLGGEIVEPGAGLAQMRLDVGEAGALERGVLAAVAGGAHPVECVGVVAIGERGLELPLLRGESAISRSIRSRSAIASRCFSSNSPRRSHYASTVRPCSTRRGQFVRLLLQRRKLCLIGGDHVVEVADEAILAALLDVQARLAEEWTIAHPRLLAREAMVLDARLHLANPPSRVFSSASIAAKRSTTSCCARILFS